MGGTVTLKKMLSHVTMIYTEYVTFSHSHPSLTFAVKAVAYLRTALKELPSNNGLSVGSVK